MGPRNLTIVVLVLFFLYETYAQFCDEVSHKITKPKSNEVNKYMIVIEGHPTGYKPHQKYNVTLKANPSDSHKFEKFAITIQPEDVNSNSNTGRFEIESEVTTKFSTGFPNTVLESSSVPRKEVKVYWIAPPKDSGCISIKGKVVVSEEIWYCENGQLTVTLCEDTSADPNVQPERLQQCCACSEAKYEVAFEGRWSRNTHPKNYPSDLWTTKFSDIIGASHQQDYTLWDEQTDASEGLKELAATGITSILESDIKENSEHVRTIIKARGLQYPNITQSSYAVFRVDNKNHLVSLVSKIIPSPDWIVGVSNFELCRTNGSWIESYTYNLYPFDVGIDDGTDYLDSKPVNRSKPITAITQDNPNTDSPFFNENGEVMNPIAKLHFRIQRLYKKDCDNMEKCDETQESTTTISPEDNY